MSIDVTSGFTHLNEGRVVARFCGGLVTLDTRDLGLDVTSGRVIIGGNWGNMVEERPAAI